MLDTLERYETSWIRLNDSLRLAEASEGLAGALAMLEASQRGNGFISDEMDEVERHVFRHPADPTRYFRVQFNARRLVRFNGAGIAVPPHGAEVANGGCFLCRENIRWQQQGRQLAFELDSDGRSYNAWMNPFPLMPGHIVIASATHEGQEWSYGANGGLELPRLISDLVGFASRMPGFVGYYNGVDAGASIAGHLHFQFFRRPHDFPYFPLEALLSDRLAENGGPLVVSDYALPVVKWSGAPDRVTAAAGGWISSWASKNIGRISSLTGNIIAFAEDENSLTLCFIPRDRAKCRAEGMSGMIGGLEVLGELVFSSPEERRLLDEGEVDYFTIENILSSVRTPLFVDGE